MNPVDPCVLPWVEMHVDPASQRKNCCAQDLPVEVAGNSLRDAFNGPRFRALREDFLSGKTPTPCLNCTKAALAGGSYRTAKAPQWNHLKALLLDPGRQAENLTIRFLDLRFSNLCNFACRTCDSFSSSRWRALDAAMGRQPAPAAPAENLLPQVLEILDGLEEIYFAGGEPLLHREHYLLLEEIARRDLKHIRLTYNSNLSVLGAFGFEAPALWRRMESVRVYPSLDSIGRRGEYIRAGLDWGAFQRNLALIRPFSGNIQCVLSAYNVFSLRDLVLWARREGLSVSIFPAYHPAVISAAALPAAVRKRAAEELNALAEEDTLDAFTAGEVRNAASFLTRPGTDPDGREFFAWNQRLDQAHGTNFLEIFPEHRCWAIDGRDRRRPREN